MTWRGKRRVITSRSSSSLVAFDRAVPRSFTGYLTAPGALSGDKLNTLVSLAPFAAQHGMVWVNLDLLPRSGEEGDLNRLGRLARRRRAVGRCLARIHPPAGDLRTAEHLGRRVAELAARLARVPAVA